MSVTMVEQGPDEVVAEVRTAEGDMGRVIGRRGRVAKAIRPRPEPQETKRASTLASSSSTDPGRFVIGRLGRPHGLDGFLGIYVDEEDIGWPGAGLDRVSGGPSARGAGGSSR